MEKSNRALIESLINLEDYPLQRPDSPVYQSLVRDQRDRLQELMLLNFENFLTPVGTTCLTQEIEARIADAFHSTRKANAYGTGGTKDLPSNHPQNTFAQTDRYGLAHHQLRGTWLHAIYTWEPIRRFVADILDIDTLYLHADPSNALVVQIYKKDGQLAWHFDRAQYSTILNIKSSDYGGVFEYVSALRSDGAPCHGDVHAVLANESDRVKHCQSKAGSFTIMQGRHTLHRVTKNLSDTTRISAVLSYEERPGVKLDSATRVRFFGPSAPVN